MKKRKLRKNIVSKLLILLVLVVLIASGGLIIKKRMGGHKPSPTEPPSASAAPLPPATISGIWDIPYTTADIKATAYDQTDGFVSSWYPYMTDAGIAAELTYDTYSISVDYPGEALDSALLYRDGINLIQGNEVTFAFHASSTADRRIRVTIADANTFEIFAQQEFNVNGEEQAFDLNFKMEKPTTFNGRISFDLGNDGTVTDIAHQVTLSHVRFNPGTVSSEIRVNQIGYPSESQKRFTAPYNMGDCFDVVDAVTHETVYTGALVHGRNNEMTNEKDYFGDFSSMTAEGTFYIRSQMGHISPSFTIAKDPYQSLATSLLNMFALQRCGMNLDTSWAGSLAHTSCHTSKAIVYNNQIVQLDVSGGWHDAGDYGRYIKPGAKAVSDLLTSYVINPSLYTDDENNPDSHNSYSDILDEARYELEWMLKMQREDGQVYNKVITKQNPSFISPDEDTQELYILDPDTASTAFFAGTMAYASMVYENIDAEFSKKCLDAAILADSSLKNQPDTKIEKNPAEVSGGTYYDEDDTDARFYMKAALYAATNKEDYLKEAKEIYNENTQSAHGLTWKQPGGYGRFLLLVGSDLAEKDSAFYEVMKNYLIQDADNLCGMADKNSYETAAYEYPWGSNGFIANSGITLSMAYHLTGNVKYQSSAQEQLNYLLGKNSLNMCFVTGYGSLSPKNVHSRLSIAKNTLFPGALVGGPDSFREDQITQQLSGDLPIAKIYADDINSWTTNELAVYWNSAIVSLISMLI